MVRLPRIGATASPTLPGGARRAARGQRAEPVDRRSGDRRHHDPLLCGIRVRLLLSALAQQHRPVAPGGCRPVPEVWPGDRPPVRGQRGRPRLRGLGGAPGARVAGRRGRLAGARPCRLRGAGARVRAAPFRAARRRVRERVHRLDDLLRRLRAAGPRAGSRSCSPRGCATADGRPSTCRPGWETPRSTGSCWRASAWSPGRSSTCSEPCSRRRCPSTGPGPATRR